MVIRVPVWFARGTTFHPRFIVVWWRRDAWKMRVATDHELIHAAQQRRDGWWRFMRRYFTDGKARADYELEAYGKADFPAERAIHGDRTQEAVLGALAAKIRSSRWLRFWGGMPKAAEWYEAKLRAYAGGPT